MEFARNECNGAKFQTFLLWIVDAMILFGENWTLIQMLYCTIQNNIISMGCQNMCIIMSLTERVTPNEARQ